MGLAPVLKLFELKIHTAGANAGHGLGTPLEKQIAENADVFAFLASQLEGSD